MEHDILFCAQCYKELKSGEILRDWITKALIHVSCEDKYIHDKKSSDESYKELMLLDILILPDVIKNEVLQWTKPNVAGAGKE